MGIYNANCISVSFCISDVDNLLVSLNTSRVFYASV